jgi:two-component system response regulator RegA
MTETEAERQLLIVEDDDAFARTLGRSFERRGYTRAAGGNLEEVEALLAHPLARLRRGRPEAQRRGLGPGLRADLHRHNPRC